MESGEYRFIPAGAGNTQKVPVVPDERPVYPRWRGEHRAHFRKIQIIHGLSPLARGTRQRARQTHSGRRFIPAGAGNTVISHLTACTPQVYPRWRGEHSHSPTTISPCNGLSPLARGTPLRQVDPVRQRRFIPAGAGNTLGLGLGLGSDAVYPRWRGEHTSFSLNDNPQRGLSPLARGTRKIAMSWLRPLAVYPRWRGEHQSRIRYPTCIFGLSPLARGTH